MDGLIGGTRKRRRLSKISHDGFFVFRALERLLMMLLVVVTIVAARSSCDVAECTPFILHDRRQGRTNQK